VLTAATAKTYLSRYIGAGNDANQRLSLVIERILKASNPRGSKHRIIVNVNADANQDAFVSLPREFNTVLAAVPITDTLRNGGCPVPVSNDWFGYLPGDPGTYDGTWRNVIPVQGRFTTFSDWSVPKQLRFKFETAENPGTFIVKGYLAGQKLYSFINAVWSEGIAVPYLNANMPVTTTQTFDQPPYQIIKPVTNGRVTLATVDSNNVETVVAIYDPDEIAPAFRRYKVPVECVFGGLQPIFA
jgi:hypothetical protein